MTVEDPLAVTVRPPDVVGRSRRLWRIHGGLCVVQLIPVEEEARLRLDFHERAARWLDAADVPTAFISRLAPDTCLARYVPSPRFEVTVENVSREPAVRFDRGDDPRAIEALALAAGALLRERLRPADLLDVRFVVGRRPDGRLTITSEISPDRMRLRVPA